MLSRLFFLMRRRRPRSTRTDTPFPYTTLCRSLEQVVRPLPAPPPRPDTAPVAIFAALAALRDHQPLNRATGAVHAAAWYDPTGAILAVFEDVGRHNALDKLIGHIARSVVR